MCELSPRCPKGALLKGMSSSLLKLPSANSLSREVTAATRTQTLKADSCVSAS